MSNKPEGGHLLTVFNMTLHALPDLKAQTTDMLSHIQQRVAGQAALFTGPLGSGAKMVTDLVSPKAFYLQQRRLKA